MIVYSTTSKKAITTAVTKAKKCKPMVRPVAGEFGKYTVFGSEGHNYLVSFTKVAGEFTRRLHLQSWKQWAGMLPRSSDQRDLQEGGGGSGG